MKKLIIRVDDVGFSDVYNIGTFETIERGVSTAADVMLDSPGTVDALERLKSFPWISVGWHMHMWGAPVLPAAQVPSLVESGGIFSDRFRTDLAMAESVSYEESCAELRAQLERCVAVLGKVPDTCGLMPGESPWRRAVKTVVEEYGIAHGFAVKKGMDPRVVARIVQAQKAGESWAAHYRINTDDRQPDPRWADRKIVIVDGSFAYIDLYTDSVTAVEENYDPVKYYTEDRAGILKYADDVTIEQSWHPGYLDYHVYRLGERVNRDRARQFTVGRVQDVAALCSSELKEWIKANKIELLNFRDALYGTREYQNHLRNARSDLCAI